MASLTRVLNKVCRRKSYFFSGAVLVFLVAALLFALYFLDKGLKFFPKAATGLTNTRGDLNGDNFVNAEDINYLKTHFSNVFDYNAIVANYGADLRTPTPTPTPIVCFPSAPSLTIVPDSQSGIAGQQLNYLATAKDNDSGGCPAKTFSLTTESLSPGWSRQPAIYDNISLSPGQSKTFVVMIWSAPGSSPGTYTFTEKLLETASGLSTTTSARYEVLPAATTSLTPRVLFVQLNPSDGSRDLFTTYYSWQWSGHSFADVVDTTLQNTINVMKELSGGMINYRVVGRLQINNFPRFTDGFQFTIDNYKPCTNGGMLPNGKSCGDEKWLFDNVDFVRSNNICQVAGSLNADEIWLVNPPFIQQWESWMIGPSGTDGFSPNGEYYPIEGCQKHYIVQGMGPSLISVFLHMYGHRVEATMAYLTGFWDQSERQKYWENFANVSRYVMPYNQPGPQYQGPGCGNAHFPLNGIQHYDYWNQTYRDFNCPDWKNFPNFKGEVEHINCTAWGCNDDNLTSGWGKHWLGSLPRGDGEAQIRLANGKMVNFKRNWWYYLLYPENAIQFVKMATGQLTSSQ